MATACAHVARPKTETPMTHHDQAQPPTGDRQSAHPFVPGPAVFGCWDAERGPDGVWFVPDQEMDDDR